MPFSTSFPKEYRFLSARYMFNSLAFVDILSLFVRIIYEFSRRSSFWFLSYTEKLVVIKSYLSFHLNFLFFKRFFSYSFPFYNYLYVSNFYSASNLGLIKAAIKCGLHVSDIQHGVQTNVAAYEYFNHIPTPIKPHELIHWYSNQVAVQTTPKYM